jgi:hypothetical protein
LALVDLILSVGTNCSENRTKQYFQKSPSHGLVQSGLQPLYKGYSLQRAPAAKLCTKSSSGSLYKWKGLFERLIFLWGIGVQNARLLGFKQK